MGAPNLFVVLGAILPRCAPAAISHKFQRYTASTKQYKINRTFNIQRKFPNHNNQGEAEIPDKQETRRFWNNIWGTLKIHNAAEWTQKEYFDVLTQKAQI